MSSEPSGVSSPSPGPHIRDICRLLGGRPPPRKIPCMAKRACAGPHPGWIPGHGGSCGVIKAIKAYRRRRHTGCPAPGSGLGTASMHPARAGPSHPNPALGRRSDVALWDPGSPRAGAASAPKSPAVWAATIPAPGRTPTSPSRKIAHESAAS
ncbi:hypothetical protein H696_04189 [Fonticula alba]|uniref:Uncharacterized protein n=1 Tax=Fonticula alba TaxID=691883 RepID=A0A058Z6M6_FONAL|nr:hypothetical protein H696_04189 [Fonticula alba]KCV69776.1 hypothetical protein H696_04189 [Fonticula alba]|eukprot:XP_009496341.1 hypothetical protein H696_04189 [Fonticula alba]